MVLVVNSQCFIRPLVFSFFWGGKRGRTIETEVFGDIYVIKTSTDQNNMKGDI